MRFIVCLYVDGCDLQDVVASIKPQLTEIAGNFPPVRVINDRFDRTPDLHSEDLPEWNLGLNFDLDQESASFVPKLLESIRLLSRKSGRDFAVGYFDGASNIDEDIGFIDANTPCDDIVEILASLTAN